MKLWQIYTTGRFIALVLALLLSHSVNAANFATQHLAYQNCVVGNAVSISLFNLICGTPSHLPNTMRLFRLSNGERYGNYQDTFDIPSPGFLYGFSITCASGVNTACYIGSTFYSECASGQTRNESNVCLSDTPICSDQVETGLTCLNNGQTVTVGTAPGNYDKNYSQIVPTCPTGQSYILGSCSSLPIGLAALAGTLQTQWQRLPNGVNQALGTHAAETLSEFEQLLAKERPAMSEFEKLLAKDGKVTMSEFERLLSKEFTPVAERIAANSGILAKAVPILNTAVWAYTGWELYEYGKVLLDQRETRNALGGTCPSGFSGSDCDTPTTSSTQWPADDKPTYIYQPNNPVQPYVHHPRDPDRTVYDMTQTSPGRWEHVQYDSGATGDIYIAPTASAGPIIIERTELPNRGGRIVTITSLTTGAIRGYQPDSSVKPADFTAPGPITVINPPLNNPTACTPTAPNPDLTPEQHITCRRQVPKPITDPAYKPYPNTNPTPSTPTQPDKLIAPTAPPATTPQPYSPPLLNPVTGQTPSPFKVPTLNPTPNPTPEEEENPTPFGSCGCTLQPPDLNAPTLAETTDQLIEKMNTGMGANVAIPTMTGQCPVIGIDLTGNQYGLFKSFGNLTTDVHCQILEQNRTFIEATAVLFALITGLMIVMGP